MSDAAFARAFERGEIANADFHHADHLRLALAYLQESDTVDQAAERMSAALRRFATALGHPEKYHHTITVFWIRMLARLLDQQLPLAFYSRERLWSAAARAGWLEPDLQDLNNNANNADRVDIADAAPRPADSPCDASDWPVSR